MVSKAFFSEPQGEVCSQICGDKRCFESAIHFIECGHFVTSVGQLMTVWSMKCFSNAELLGNI